MSREVQEVGELTSGRGPETKDWTTSTAVCTTNTRFHSCNCFPIHQIFSHHFPILCHSSKGPQSELSDPDTQSFDPMFKQAEVPNQMPTHNKDYGYGYNPESTVQMRDADDLSSPGIVDSHCI